MDMQRICFQTSRHHVQSFRGGCCERLYDQHTTCFGVKYEFRTELSAFPLAFFFLVVVDSGNEKKKVEKPMVMKKSKREKFHLRPIFYTKICCMMIVRIA